MNRSKKKTSRRELFRTAARGIALAAAGAAAVLLGRRGGKTGSQGDHKCTNIGMCGKCDTYKTCFLPRAMVRRRYRDEG